MNMKMHTMETIAVRLPKEPHVGVRVDNTTAMILERGGCDIVLDCSNVDFLSTRSLCSIFRLRNNLELLGHKLMLCNVSYLTRGILSASGFTQIQSGSMSFDHESDSLEAEIFVQTPDGKEKKLIKRKFFRLFVPIFLDVKVELHKTACVGDTEPQHHHGRLTNISPGGCEVIMDRNLLGLVRGDKIKINIDASRERIFISLEAIVQNMFDDNRKHQTILNLAFCNLEENQRAQTKLGCLYELATDYYCCKPGDNTAHE